MNDLHPNCKVWIYSESREGVFGDGKVRLLEAISRHGSLREAATALGISYRKAWGDLRKAETCLQIQLIDRQRGGKGGGHTGLTPAGEALLKAYHRFRAEAQECLAKCFDKHLKEVIP